LSWRAQAYKNGSGRGRRYKEEERIVPTSPSSTPSIPNCVVQALKCSRLVSLAKTRRSRANFPLYKNTKIC